MTAVALAAAGPALAADDLAPLPPLPEPPSAAVPDTELVPAVPDPLPIPAPAAAPPLEGLSQDEPPITVAVTESDGGIDVSVRVLSPGVDGTTSEQGAEPNVVSPEAEADITGEPVSPPAGEAGVSATGATDSNVNVSVRVLSPGDDGRVEQADTGDDGNHALPSAIALVESMAPVLAPQETTPAEAPSADDDAEPSPAENAGQYHASNSRYQSDVQSAEATWSWAWYLALDCDGSASYSSKETGSQSSLNWLWEWTWEWSCGSPPRPPPLEETGAETANQGSEPGLGVVRGGSTSSEQGPDDGAPQEPWQWTWTFTFCGETVSATLPLSPLTELRWQWDWSWSWTCEAPASEPAPTTPDPLLPPPSLQTEQTSAGATGAELGAATPMPFGPNGVQLPAWVIPLIPFTDLVPVLPTELLRLSDALATPTIALAVAVESFLPPGPDLVPGQAGSETKSTTIVPPLVISPYPHAYPGSRPTPGDAAHAAPSAAGGLQPARATPTRPRHPGTITRAKPRTASAPGRRAPQLPVRLPPPGAAGVSGPAGGFVPSGSVLATAALVAFLFLTAPGYGRRIRVARELRPRGTYGSSIDRPG